MFYTPKQQELMKLMELHYVHGIDFPFMHQKPQKKPRKIVQAQKLPKNLHITSIWRHK